MGVSSLNSGKGSGELGISRVESGFYGIRRLELARGLAGDDKRFFLGCFHSFGTQKRGLVLSLKERVSVI